MPKILIKTKGNRGQVLIDGKEVPGVRKLHLEIDANKNSVPVLILELNADNLTIDSDGILPQLPEAYRPFYKYIGSEDKL